MSTVCGKYCCLFVLYMDRGYTGKQFVGLFTPNLADQQVEQLFTSEFGSVRGVPRGGQCCTSRYKRWVPKRYYIICKLYFEGDGGCYWLRILVGGTRWRSNQGSFCGIWKCPRNISFCNPLLHGPHDSDSCGISWDDGIIASSLFQTWTDATANFAHIYAKGTAKCRFISTLLGRSVKNLDTFGCLSRKSFRMTTGCSLPCYVSRQELCGP